MKKLMFATAVAAAGLAYGIESANIVGYTEVPRYSTFTFAGSMFAQPGQSYYYLDKVTVDSVDDAGADFIQFFKPGTTVLDRDQAYYFDGDDWCATLVVMPEMASKCDWSRLCTYHLVEILSIQPGLVTYSDLSAFDGWDWMQLLKEQPSLRSSREYKPPAKDCPTGTFSNLSLRLLHTK